MTQAINRTHQTRLAQEILSKSKLNKDSRTYKLAEEILKIYWTVNPTGENRVTKACEAAAARINLGDQACGMSLAQYYAAKAMEQAGRQLRAGGNTPLQSTLTEERTLVSA